MADPQTSNILLSVPLRGSDVGTWDIPVNGDFTAIDGFIGGVQPIAVTDGSLTLLSVPSGAIVPAPGPTQAQNAVLRFTGTLSGSGAAVVLPFPGYYIIDNQTIGGALLAFRTSVGGSGFIVCIQQGSIQHIYNDGTNVYFVNLPPIGSYLDYAGSTVPNWIANCTVPPYLNCNGSAFSGTTYPQLAAILGGTTLPDLRGVARYALNQGTGRLTSAGSGLDGNTLFATKFTQTYTILTANLPPYTPSGVPTSSPIILNQDTYTVSPGPTTLYGQSGSVPANQTPIITPHYDPQGGTSTPFGVVGPGTVSGITLIRAA